MSDSRVRLLLLRAYFLQNTDERHTVTARELIAHLELLGIPSDRQTVYADILLLQQNGLDIRTQRRKANEYYLAGRLFEREELRLLSDMVRASRVLSPERASSLIDKLLTLTSRQEAAQLRRQRTFSGPYQARDERAFYNAAAIQSAIENGRKLSFVYCSIQEKNTLLPRRGGEAYIVNPCLLAYVEDHYYLIADHPAHEGLAHYRLDKMADVLALEEAASPADSGFDATAYARTVFSMASAEQRWVRLSFDRLLIGAVLDRFGSDVPMEQLDENTYAIMAPVRVSPPFFGWVFQFCGRMRILAPEDVCERMLLMLEATRSAGLRR